MANISWNESSPAGADSAGLGAQEFRSLKTAIRTGLDTEHNWPSAGGDAGVHRLGSGRPYYGPQSAVSSTGTDGRLMMTSDTSRLFGVGSAATVLIGGPTVISAGSFPGGLPQRHYWAVEFGIAGLNSSGSATVTIPNSGYSGVPFIYLTTQLGVANSRWFAWTYSETNTSFGIGGWNEFAGSATGNPNVQWLSIGSRVL